jgi:hypothetical protein
MQPVLIGMTYLLVKCCDWSVWTAGGAIALIGMAVPLIAGVVICLFLPIEHRREFWRIVFSTATEDLKNIFDLLTFRK